jgi:hypothetical protein
MREHKIGCTVAVARSAQARDAARSMLGLDSFEKLLAWIQPCLGSYTGSGRLFVTTGGSLESHPVALLFFPA